MSTYSSQLPALVHARLDNLNGRVRRMIWMRGGGIVFTFVASLIALGLLVDWMFQLPMGVRVGLLAGIVGGSLWGLRKWLVHPLSLRLGSAALEKQHPELAERLSRPLS